MRNIVIADKQDITRIGIESLITNVVNTPIFSQAQNKSSLIKMLMLHSDAFVVLDYSLFDFASADELLNVHARFPNVRWLLFSDELSVDFLKRLLLNSESFGVILKACDENEIITALSLSIKGEQYICSRVTNQILMSNKSSQHKAENILTVTETEILKEIALGRTTKEIAASRNISFHTIITHRKNIFRKLEVNNVYEATKYAMRAGIIDVAEYYI